MSEPSSPHAERVRRLFHRIAPRYDFINDLQSLGLHRRWKRRLVALARTGPGQRALDLCCGTGDVTLALAAAGAETVGLDFTESMLEIARRRALAAAGPGTGSPRRNLTVSFQRGDALRIPFPDHTFDVVTISYGLRNLASVERGLAEMQRVTRPGGRLLVLDFGKPSNRWWRRLYFAYLRLAVPVCGRVFCGDAAAYAYILESLRKYPAQEGVARIMREQGLANVQVHAFLGGAMGINYAEVPGGTATGAAGP